MAKLLYVEPGDEIPDLIDRIRRAEADRDLVFVVPPDARVLHSPLELRLLMQYARGFQKRVAVVSGDPQVQGQAIRAGFPTFASLARLEQGAALRAVPEVAAAPAAEEAAELAPAKVRGRTKPPPGAKAEPTQLATRRPAELLAAGGAGAAGWWAPMKGLWGSQHRAITLATAGVIVLLVIVLFALPSATVTLGVQAHRLVDNATIQGNDGPQSGNTLDQVSTQALQTQTFSQSFKLTPSGTQSLPPVPATGGLEFCWSGPNPNLTLSFSGQAPEFEDNSSGNAGFTTTSAGQNQTVALPQCGGSTYSDPVAVQGDANTVGTQGNVDPGGSWNWTNYSSSGCVSPPPAGSACVNNVNRVQITNQQAMSGGKDATTQSVFSTSDATAAQQKMQQIDTKLTQKADQQLKRLAGKSVLAVDKNGKGIVVTATNPTLPTGCNTSASAPCPAAQAETLTVTVSAVASAYNPAAVRSAILRDLRSKVPKDAELLANPQLGQPKVLAAGAGGTVTLSSKAIGYWAPKLDLGPLQSQLGSRGNGSARAFLLRHLPRGSTVSISESPIPWPWLPILSGRIHLVRESLTQGTGSG
ncbi:MAG: hypothetical protein ACREOL_10000 [Candidatus Dormibacteria bacterium]